MFSAADVQWVDHCSRHYSMFDTDFMQQLCYNVIEEITGALNEEIMLQLASATLFSWNYRMLLSNSKQNQ